MTTRSATFALLTATMVALPSLVAAQQSVRIDAPVTTGFSVFTPYQVPPYRPSAGLSEPSISGDFSNVATGGGAFPWTQFFSSAERSLLQRNSFVARPEAFGSFGELYAKTSGTDELPSFITTDAVLHGLRITVDEIEGKVERDYLAPELTDILGRIAAAISGQLNTERNPALVEALRSALAYVETGRALIDPSATVNARVRDAVEAELEQIRRGSGVAVSSVLPDRRIDYGMFAAAAPSRTDVAANYERARIWLGSVGLTLRSESGEASPRQIRMAALLARTLDQLSSEGAFLERYRGVVETAAFIGGHSERDITWDMIAGALRGYYGSAITGGISPLENDSLVVEFARYAERQVPTPALERTGPRLFRLMPAPEPRRGLVDRIVTDATAPARVIAAALGDQSLGSPEFRRLFADRVAEDWVNSLEAAVIYTMQPVAESTDRPNGYPRFARTDAWQAMRSANALGAWADFLHPVTRMTLPSVRVGIATTSRGDIGTPGYVEPNPEAWSRIASLARMVREGFTNDRMKGIVGPTLEQKLSDIENTAARMMQIAAAEINGTEVTDDQALLIASMKTRLAAYEKYADAKLAARGAAILAGASEAAGGSVAPATGLPLTIYVIVPRTDGTGGLMLTRGGVYSYLETQGSSSEFVSRITSGGAAPALPIDASSWLSPDRSLSQSAKGFQAIDASLPSNSVAYAPTREERKRMLPTVELNLDANIVRRSEGELWFTVKAPQLTGTDIEVSVLNTGGREVYRTTPGRIDNGQRYDLIRVDMLQPGQYFLRVTDQGDRTLASGRFIVVR